MYEFDSVGCMVTRDGTIYQICSSEDSAQAVVELCRKCQIVQVNERTRLAYMNFVALRDGHTVSKVA